MNEKIIKDNKKSITVLTFNTNYDKNNFYPF
jgi:hypothetical protein